MRKFHEFVAANEDLSSSQELGASEITPRGQNWEADAAVRSKVIQAMKIADPDLRLNFNDDKEREQARDQLQAAGKMVKDAVDLVILWGPSKSRANVGQVLSKSGDLGRMSFDEPEPELGSEPPF